MIEILPSGEFPIKKISKTAFYVELPGGSLLRLPIHLLGEDYQPKRPEAANANRR